MAIKNSNTMTAKPTPAARRGRLPDPGTGSRNGQFASADMTDNVTEWAQNWAQAPYAPRLPTSGDLNASGAFGRQ